MEVVGVGEEDLGADLAQVTWEDAAHRAAGAHWLEGRRLDGAVRRVEEASARFAVRSDEVKGESSHRVSVLSQGVLTRFQLWVEVPG